MIDVNGDGFDDVMMSDCCGTGAYLIYGSNSMKSTYNLGSLDPGDGVTFTSSSTLSIGRAGDVSIEFTF